MAEEGRERKKSAIIRRTLRWIGLGLLSLLLIAAIVFQAPWKVTALVLILLLACTALPRPARKWFWLSVGIIIVALIIWVFLPDDSQGWRPYTFDEELAALEAKYAIPPEENAARVYNILLEEYDSNAMHPGFLALELDRLTMSEPWATGDYPELAEWLKGHEGTITKLLEASKIEKCRFAISPSVLDLSKSMLHSPAMRNWARLLARGANNDMAESRIDQAIEKNLAVVAMGNHLCQQSTMIDLLSGIAVEALAIGQFKKLSLTTDVTEEQLTTIEEAFAGIRHDWRSDLIGILEYEKLCAKNILGMFYERNPKAEVRLSRDPLAAIRARFPQEVPPQTYWQRKLTKAGVILALFFIPSTPQKAAKIFDAAFETFYAMAEPDFDWQKEPKEVSITSLFAPRVRYNYPRMVRLLADTSEKGYYRLHDIFLRVTADRTGSLLLIALRRYKNKNGNWPKSLDDIKDITAPENLVDPINDNSFVYKLTDDGFTLYSKGQNNLDENGQRADDADDWLIWPPRSRKTKEENPNAE